MSDGVTPPSPSSSCAPTESCAAPMPRSTTPGPACTAWRSQSCSGRWTWPPWVKPCRVMCRPSSSAWAETPGMGDEARILIVCTGNICRSPFIERLLQHELDERLSGPGPGVTVRSAGTAALVGSAMDPRASAQLISRGGDPAGFRAREISPAIIAESDLVLTATRAHRGKVALMSPKVLRRVFTFCDFADLVAGVDGFTAPVMHTDPRGWVRQVTEKAAANRGLRPPLAPEMADIVDPYRREEEVFVTIAQQIVDSLSAVVRTLVG